MYHLGYLALHHPHSMKSGQIPTRFFQHWTPCSSGSAWFQTWLPSTERSGRRCPKTCKTLTFGIFIHKHTWIAAMSFVKPPLAYQWMFHPEHSSSSFHWLISVPFPPNIGKRTWEVLWFLSVFKRHKFLKVTDIKPNGFSSCRSLNSTVVWFNMSL